MAGEITGSIKALIGADTGDYKKAMAEVLSVTNTSMANVAKNMTSSTNGILSKVGSIMGQLGSTVSGKLSGLKTSLVAPFSTAGGQIQRVISNIGAKIPEPFRSAFSKVSSSATSAFSSLQSNLSGSFSKIGSTAISSFSKIGTTFSSSFSKVGTTITDASGKVNSFVSNFRSGMKQSQNDAESFSSKLGKISIAVAAMYVANKAISAISSGISDLVGGLNEGSATWKTFNANMENIGMGKKEIASVKAELQDFATKTIYSASDMATTYSQLAAVGIKSTDKLVMGFGGLAAAAADPTQAMTTLSQQATQMAAKPMVQWQDFKLMLEQTPAGIAAVAKEMGMSTSEMVSAVQDGKIKTEDFFNAITKVGTNDTFGKMATQYKTVGQAMDGLKETLTSKLQPAFDKLSQVGINAISKLTDKIGDINVDKLTDSIMNGVNNAIPVIESIFNVLSKTFGFISSHIDVIKSLGAGILVATTAFKLLRTAANISATISAVSAALKGSTAALSALSNSSKIAAAAQWAFNAAMNANPIVLVTTLLIALVAGLVYFFTQTKTGQKIVTSAWNAIKSAISTSVEAIKNIWSTMTQVLSNVWESTKTATINAWNTITSTLSSVWETIKATVSNVFTAITTTISNAWQATISGVTTAWNTIVTTIQTVIGSIISFVTTNFSGMISGLQTIWNGLITIATNVWDLLKNTILGPVLLLADLVTGNFKKLSSDTSAIWNNMKEAASNIWQGINTVISGVVQTIQGYVTGVWNVLKDTSANIWNAMKSAASSTWNALQNAISNTVQTIKSTVSNIFQATVNTAQNLWQSLRNSISNIVSSIRSGIVNGFNNAKYAAIDIFNGIRSGISGAMSAASNFVSSAIERIKSFFYSLGNVNLYWIGMNIISGLINGITGMLGRLWNTISNIASGIASKISGILGIHSPSRVLYQIGAYTGQGLINGMDSMQKGVAKQAGAFADTIAAQQYQAQAVMAADTTFTNRNISTFTDDMDKDVAESELKREEIYVHNELVGDKIYTTVKRKEARDRNKDKYFQ